MARWVGRRVYVRVEEGREEGGFGMGDGLVGEDGLGRQGMSSVMVWARLVDGTKRATTTVPRRRMPSRRLGLV